MESRNSRILQKILEVIISQLLGFLNALFYLTLTLKTPIRVTKKDFDDIESYMEKYIEREKLKYGENYVERKIDEVKEYYINMFYDFLQPVYGNSTNVILRITLQPNEVEKREIIGENKVSKLTTNTVAVDDKELQTPTSYFYYYFEPIRLLKSFLKLENIEKTKINLNYFKLISIDWFMSFLKEFSLKYKNTLKISDKADSDSTSIKRIRNILVKLEETIKDKYDENFNGIDNDYISEKVDKLTNKVLIDSYKKFEDNFLPNLNSIKEQLNNYEEVVRDTNDYKKICDAKGIASKSINNLIKLIDTIKVAKIDEFDEIRKLMKELKLLGLRKTSWEKNNDYKTILISDINEKLEKIKQIEKLLGSANEK